MKKNFITEEEKKSILEMYKNYLVEGDIFSTFFGKMVRFARKAIMSSEDDLIKAFKTTESALAHNIDEIVESSIKSGNLQDIQNLESKLVHAFDPGGVNPQMAQEQTKKFLNSYAKSRGNSGWKDIRSKASPNQTGGSAQSSAAGSSAGAVKNTMSGQRVSNRWYLWKPENIDFTKFSNPGTTFEQLNKNISTAIKTGQWNLVPRNGFEKFGITNFREFLQKNIKNINELVPETGRWSVNFL